MSYQISFNSANRIVGVRYLARTNITEQMDVLGQVSEKYQHLEPLRILVDVCHAEVALSGQDQQRLGRHLAGHPVLGRARIAMVHRGEFYPAAVVAREATRHGLSLQQFVLESEAMEWLMASQPA